MYVDGAVKEEFGLAVLEAMAAGLVVVAPSTGGPSTYVDDGDTGVLVDPGADLGVAIRRAFGLVGRPGRSVRRAPTWSSSATRSTRWPHGSSISTDRRW